MFPSAAAEWENCARSPCLPYLYRLTATQSTLLPLNPPYRHAMRIRIRMFGLTEEETSFLCTALGLMAPSSLRTKLMILFTAEEESEEESESDSMQGIEEVRTAAICHAAACKVTHDSW